MKMAPRTPDMRGAIMRPALCIRTRALSLNKTARPGSGQSELFVATNGARTHCHEDPSDNTIAARAIEINSNSLDRVTTYESTYSFPQPNVRAEQN
jgi:hypothetical protein